MKPKINRTSKYIEIIGHYDDPVLCAKLTLLADLYAVEHREGYAKFRVEDEDKLDLINNELEFITVPVAIWIDGGDYIPGGAIVSVPLHKTVSITSTGIEVDGVSKWTASPPTGESFLGFSTTIGATIPDSNLEVGDSFQVETSDTIKWYSRYGTLTPSLSDLTGTKWVFNDEINVSDYNSFAINFISNNTNYTYIQTGGTGGGRLRYCVDDISVRIVYDSGQEPPFIAGWTDDAYKTIEITGGTDATNATLISWLQANATQMQSGPTYTVSTTTDNCEITNVSFILTPNSGYKLPSSISVTNATLVSYNSTSGEVVLSGVSNDTSVDVEFSVVQLISFSIDNATYQAESGMTWEQWCASEYNTNGFFQVLNNQITPDNGLRSVIGVVPTDTITSNGSYHVAGGASN